MWEGAGRSTSAACAPSNGTIVVTHPGTVITRIHPATSDVEPVLNRIWAALRCPTLEHIIRKIICLEAIDNTRCLPGT